jgi:hypothetical protein
VISEVGLIVSWLSLPVACCSVLLGVLACWLCLGQSSQQITKHQSYMTITNCLHAKQVLADKCTAEQARHNYDAPFNAVLGYHCGSQWIVIVRATLQSESEGSILARENQTKITKLTTKKRLAPCKGKPKRIL